MNAHQNKPYINIVIPMAGEGSRLAKAGYKKPKPFIDVQGKPMILRVLENLYCPRARFILIIRPEHLERERALFDQIDQDYDAVFVTVNQLTEGNACTVLFARQYINNDQPLLIAYVDQTVDIEIADFMDDCHDRHLDGSILCFEDAARDPKWSFAKTGDDGLVVEVREKKAISNQATVGIYYFSAGRYFVDAAIDMIVGNDRVNQEFYTCPVYNYAIRQGKRIGTYNISSSAMHGMGTAEDLEKHLAYLHLLAPFD